MQLKKNIATSAAGFVFNPTTGDSFAASPLAAEILSCSGRGIRWLIFKLSFWTATR